VTEMSGPCPAEVGTSLFSLLIRSSGGFDAAPRVGFRANINVVSIAQDPAQRRRTPVQARSRATVDRICVAAAEILQEAGWEAFNTNAVASRAGVSITAIYSYFPDKYAIVNEIFSRMSERRMVMMAPFIKALETEDLEETFYEGVKAIAQLRIDEPAGLTMRAIYQAVPELRSADREDDHRTSDALANVFRLRNPHLPQEKAKELAFSVVVALSAAIDYSVHGGMRNDELLKTQTHMAVLYINEVLASY